MKTYKEFKLLTKNHVYSGDMEHDACSVGLIASTEGKNQTVVEYELKL